MTHRLDVAVPDIGDFQDVEVIEVLVAPGETVERERSLITLESDKATMEIPSPAAGVVRELFVAVGSQVSQGSPILALEVAERPAAAEEASGASVEAPREEVAPPEPGTGSAAPPAELPEADVQVQVLVLGAGPGGYTAAFRAADLGRSVALVERYPTLGGVCLNVGCIPSKALLHLAEVLCEVRELGEAGIEFGEPRIDLARVRARKDDVVAKLTTGLAGLAKRRGVRVVTGAGRFDAPHRLVVDTADGETTVAFEHAIVAVGSQAVEIPGLPYDDPRLMDSTDALELEEIPERLLVIGGGIIGLELAAVFHALGSSVTVVELLDALMTGTDPDLVDPLRRVVEERYENVFLSTRVTGIESRGDGLHVSFEGKDAPPRDRFDRVLVSVGRRPNGGAIAAEKAGVAVDERGFIRVDEKLRTNVPHVFAIGDVAGPPMLAHKATHEGKTAAEVIAGLPAAFDARAIPSVAYTDPEVAWMGLSEGEARERGVAYEKAVFPWSASGRALAIGRGEGRTKLLFDPETHRLLGAGIVGRNAGELIAELVLALELGADTEDLALAIHPHPTLSETLAFAAELAEGTITDLVAPRKRPAPGTRG